MSGLDPEFGIKMVEIRVAEINAPFNKNNAEVNAHKN